MSGKQYSWSHSSKQVDLALSGTGPIRFAAWVGVLRYIEQMGYGIRRLVGTSGGALVGGMYKAGLTVDEIEKILLETNYAKFAKSGFLKLMKAILAPRIFGGGYMNNGRKLERFFYRNTDGATMFDAKGLSIVTTDMVNGRMLVFSSESHPDMPVSKAIRASISLPVIWNGVHYQYDRREVEEIMSECCIDPQPVWHDPAVEVSCKRCGYRFRTRTVLMDGGLRNNFAINLLTEQGTDDRVPVIGFAIEHDFCTIQELYNFKDVMGSVISNLVDATKVEHMKDAFGAHIVEIEHGGLDVGSNVTKFTVGTEEKERWIDIGYEAARMNWNRLVA